MDWSLLQSFAAVAQHGSLTAAAQATGATQPTLSRHISVLEQQLGTRLFERSKTGVTLTDPGFRLVEHARDMADAAHKLTMAHEGQNDGLTGTVRITASQIMATYILPDLVTTLHVKHPEIAFEIVASDETNNLSRREADIAVRMYRPTQNDVVAQHVGDMLIGAYATPAYIQRNGGLDEPQDLLHHSLVGYDRSTQIVDGLRERGIEATRDHFKFRSDDQVVCWQMVRAGFGVGFNQIAIGDADTTVVNLIPSQNVASIPVWLTAHPEVRNTARIRKVVDGLRDGLKSVIQMQKADP